MPIVPGGLGYVPYGPRLSFPPPFKCKGGEFLGFVLHADEQKLKETVNATLNNAERGFTFSPFGPFVVMMIGHYERQESIARGFAGTGYASETAMSFLVPVRRSDDDKVRIWAPFVIVDNPMSMVCGREDFGYSKSMAKFDPPGGLGDPVTVAAFGGNEGPDSQAGWTELLKVWSGHAGADTVELGEQQLAEEIYPTGLPAGLGNWIALLKDLLKKEATQVFLKQFRDAKPGNDIAYEQIIEVPLHFENDQVLPHGFWSYKITKVDTYPIVAELGVKEEDTLLAFQIKNDQELGGDDTVEMDKVDFVAGGTPTPA